MKVNVLKNVRTICGGSAIDISAGIKDLSDEVAEQLIRDGLAVAVQERVSVSAQSAQQPEPVPEPKPEPAPARAKRTTKRGGKK